MGEFAQFSILGLKIDYILRKFKEKPSIGFSPPPKQDDDPPQHQLPDNPFTLSNFLSLTRSRSQNEGLEQRRLQEEIRREERERDLKNIKILLGVHQT